MGHLIRFDGVTTQGDLDSTIALATGESFIMDARFPSTAPTSNVFLTSSTDGTDCIVLNGNPATGTFQYKIRLGGSWYDQNDAVTGLWDGDLHTIEVERSGSNFIFKVDTSTVSTIPVSTGNFDIDHINYDPTSGDVVECDVYDLTIGSNTYPVTASSVPTWADTSVDGNDITLTDASLAFIGEWEWIGDLVTIERTYTVPNGTFSEWRNEGVRRRCVRGLPMETEWLKQLGDDESSVTALNGGQLSTLYGVISSSPPTLLDIPCEEEKFTPITGTNIFWQTQKWSSWRTLGS